MKKIFFTILVLFFTIASTAVAAEFSADEIAMMGGNIEGKIYYKNSSIHRNESMGMIRIIKLPLIYQLFTKERGRINFPNYASQLQAIFAQFQSTKILK